MSCIAEYDERMPSKPISIANFLGAPHVASAVAVLALIVSVISLYYTRQSELRQLEQLVVTEGGQFSIANNRSLEVNKDFEISNISDRVVSIRELSLDVRRPTTSWPNVGSNSIEIDGKELARRDELNLLIKPGEVIKVVVEIVPSVGPMAAEFLAKHPEGTTPQRLTALCRQASIDIYDKPS